MLHGIPFDGTTTLIFIFLLAVLFALTTYSIYILLAVKDIVFILGEWGEGEKANALASSLLRIGGKIKLKV